MAGAKNCPAHQPAHRHAIWALTQIQVTLLDLWGISGRCGRLKSRALWPLNTFCHPSNAINGERRRNFFGQHFWARGYFRVNRGGRGGGHPRLYPQQGEGRSTLEQMNLRRRCSQLQVAHRTRALLTARQPLRAEPNIQPRLCLGILTLGGKLSISMLPIPGNSSLTLHKLLCSVA